ncbi:MAG: hypothetical protein Q4E65_02540 [Clostridia bacterium]|nr:hypothetical protein [Clostridia bacterium]
MSAFQVEKSENCFVDAQTYAYASPFVMDEAAVAALSPFGEVEIKRNYRRPFYFVRGGGMEIKGVLGDTRFKVSYPDAAWQEKKQAFEHFLDEEINT